MRRKRLVLCAAILLLLWIGTGAIDFLRVCSFQRPLFCLAGETADDGGSGRYVGLGYAFDIEGNFMPDTENPGVTKWTYYLFGIEIETQIRD